MAARLALTAALALGQTSPYEDDAEDSPLWQDPLVDLKGHKPTINNYKEQYLFHGEMRQVYLMINESTFQHYIKGDDPTPPAQVRASLKQRQLLLFLEAFEGFCVSLGRWIIQAALTAHSGKTTHFGPSQRMLESCSEALDPPLSKLIERTSAGVVRRGDVALAIYQCTRHHNVWSELAALGGPKSVSEENRFGWKPIHYAAATGILPLADELLAYGSSSLKAKTRSGATALHVAAAHGSIAVAGRLASAMRQESIDEDDPAPRAANGVWADEWLDFERRSPEDFAIRSMGADLGKCSQLLKALQLASPVGSNAKVRKAKCLSVMEQRRTQAATMLKDSGPAKSKQRSSSSSSSSLLASDGITDQSWETSCDDEDEEEMDNEHVDKADFVDPPPCEIKVLDGASLTTHELAHAHLANGAPLLIRSSMHLPQHFKHDWTREGLASRVGDIELLLEDFPYADASAELMGVPKNKTTVHELLYGDGPGNVFKCGSLSSPSSPRSSAVGRRVESSASAPPLSVFHAVKGYRRMRHACGAACQREAAVAASSSSSAAVDVEGGGGSNAIKKKRSNKPRTEVKHDIEIDLRHPESGLLLEWTRPPYISDNSSAYDALRTASIQFYAGGKRAGAQPHWHAPAWNWLVRGRKKWFLWPPADATYSQRNVNLALDPARKAGGAPLVCVQRPGDVIMVPELWGHATENLKPSAGFATEMQFDRSFDLGIGFEYGDEWWREKKAVPKAKKKRAAPRLLSVTAAVDAKGGEVPLEPAATEQRAEEKVEVEEAAGAEAVEEVDLVQQYTRDAEEAEAIALAATEHARRLRERAEAARRGRAAVVAT